MYTASTAFLDALSETGVSYIFVNLGTDHPSIIESIAEARATGRPLPKIITCPNEMVAMSAAHAFAQITGRAQAVIVHVDCGTQALGGALHNAATGRVPVLIFAGTSPFTQRGEMRGSRNNFIQWYQDVFDQRGLVRGYVKYDNEIRSGKNIKEIVHRAMQIAHSEPRGPVYLMAAREVLAEEIAPLEFDGAAWPTIACGTMPSADVATLVHALAAARRPLVVTSYLGPESGCGRRTRPLVPTLGSRCARVGAQLRQLPRGPSPVSGKRMGRRPREPRLAGSRRDSRAG